MQPNVTTRIQCLRHTEYLSSIARTKRGWPKKQNTTQH
ncbi:hypothetical protein [Salmonella phage vB_SenAc-pSK20]|nr:reverse transcriptase domain-containing protein [Salmonella phage vB_SenA_SM5]WRQ13390.1 hypothetical protein [Salmonella phage vB_SenAc-pSK20]